MDVSLVIPLLNEEESLRELAEWISRVVKDNNLTYEIIFVDDGSTDSSWDVITALAAENEHIKGIRFKRNYGKSAGLNVGFEASEGDIVITMDADLQDSPDEIPSLVSMIREQGFDLVSGYKKKRHDPITKTIPTKLFNWTTRKVSGIKLHDFNCGLKAYKRDVVKNIEVYGEMHRYIPVIAKWTGFKNIGEKVVFHQARKYGKSKFGFERFINGFLDLLSITFVGKFSKKPMHFFGTMGMIFFLLGGGVSIYLIIMKLVHISNHTVARDVTDQPLFFLALVAMIIGTQLFLAGYLAEMIARVSHDRNKYLISEKKNIKNTDSLNNPS
ncbi:MAG: glycosyltransferase family 2 protein [Bacteroidetes bacterium]|nr:glycosyltransferase family 2 protein [Bacteroidota bacterium]MBU1717738.1 glycosyltransferase family 2 protein [Bacteroidota bacterium]